MQRRDERNAWDKALADHRPELRHVLAKLGVFLDTLTEEEWNRIPIAANALATRKSGARSAVRPRPAQPIEVVLARVFVGTKREIVGALLLRREWMDRTLKDAEREESLPAGSAQHESALDDWLNGFDRLLGSWLSREIVFASVQQHMHEPSECLDILEHYAETWPEKFEELWQLPLTQYFLPYLKQGTPVERQRLKALQKRQLTDARGRPDVDSEHSKDAAVWEQVTAVVDRLKPGWQYVSEHQADGRRDNRSMLIGMCYQRDEAEALMDAHEPKRGRRPTPRSVAVKLVAQHLGRSLESISAQASRGSRR